MTAMASQITSLTVVYSTVYSDAGQRKHQSSVSLAFVWGIHRDRWIPRTKGQLRGKCFYLMTSSWTIHYLYNGSMSPIPPSPPPHPHPTPTPTPASPPHPTPPSHQIVFFQFFNEWHESWNQEKGGIFQATKVWKGQKICTYLPVIQVFVWSNLKHIWHILKNVLNVIQLFSLS